MGRVTYRGFNLPDGAAIPDVPADLHVVVDGYYQNKPWGTAWGQVAYAQITAAAAAIGTTATAVPGLSVSYAAPLNRRLAISTWLMTSASAAGAENVIQIMRDGGSIWRGINAVPQAGRPCIVMGEVRQDSDGASHAYAVWANAGFGSGTVTIGGAANQVCYIAVDDIGPVAGSAPP